MKLIYKEAFSEIDAIFKLMPSNLLNKIPKKFREIIESEKSMTYNPIIKEPIEEFELKEETIIILALIYRDFLCSNEEKEQLKLRDAQKIKEAEEELSIKYNIDDIFKKRKNTQTDLVTEKVQSNQGSQLMVFEEKWYRKIFNIIKNIFKKS